MKKREVRLYNMIIPVWLLWMFLPLFPWVLPVTLLGNLLIDTAVLFCALLFLKCKDKGRLLKRLWWRVWLRGFAADAIGVAWLLLALILYEAGGRDAFWIPWLVPVMYNPFAHPAAFLWTLAAVVLSGVCIYRFDRKAFQETPGLTPREAHIVALSLAIVTAPWTFFIPVW